MSKKRKFKAKQIKFTDKHVTDFENISAEDEKQLPEYYYRNKYSKIAEDFYSKKSFFIGRTGSGKSAILAIAKEKYKDDFTLEISPEDFAFTIMEKSELLKKLHSDGVNLDLFYKTLWKYIFITTILKKRFGENKRSWLQKKIDSIKDKPKKRAYDFLLKNEELEGGKSFSEQVTSILERMEHTVSSKFKSKGIEFSYTGKLSPDEKKFVQSALSEFEFTDLNYFVSVLDDEVLKASHYVILIDDLDKEWIQNNVGIDFTRCLFEIIHDFNNSEKIRILVSLRTNLFDQLKFHQPEKLMPFIEKLKWSDTDLKKILEERFKNFININPSDLWSHVFPKKVHLDDGKEIPTLKYLIGRSSQRPRDIILFVRYAIMESLGKDRITADSLKKAEIAYSHDRLNALHSEWRNPFLNLERITSYFSQTKYKLTYLEFMDLLESITVSILADEELDCNPDNLWLFENQFIDKKNLDGRLLLDLLYKVGFIGWKPSPGSSVEFIHNTKVDIPPTKRLSEKAKFYINPQYFNAVQVSFYENTYQE